MDKTIIPFYGGIRFGIFNAHPRCRAQIDTRFDFYALNFGKSGSMRWGIGDEPPKAAPFPALFWTVPGVRYRYGAPDGRHWDHAYVTFSGPRVARWATEGLLPDPDTGGLQGVEHPREVGEMMARLLYILGSPERSGAEAVWLLEGLFVGLQRTRPRVSVDGKVSAIHEDLLADPVPARDWNALAARCGLSPVQFRRVFRKLYGAAPHRFLLDARLHRGAEFLRQGSSLEKAAEASGFSDPYYFSRMFANRFGTPPVRYRKRHELGADGSGAAWG